jgi:hypothetical protein
MNSKIKQLAFIGLPLAVCVFLLYDLNKESLVEVSIEERVASQLSEYAHLKSTNNQNISSKADFKPHLPKKVDDANELSLKEIENNLQHAVQRAHLVYYYRYAQSIRFITFNTFAWLYS